MFQSDSFQFTHQFGSACVANVKASCNCCCNLPVNFLLRNDSIGRIDEETMVLKTRKTLTASHTAHSDPPAQPLSK